VVAIWRSKSPAPRPTETLPELAQSLVVLGLDQEKTVFEEIEING
jgi:hypothetical protein